MCKRRTFRTGHIAFRVRLRDLWTNCVTLKKLFRSCYKPSEMSDSSRGNLRNTHSDIFKTDTIQQINGPSPLEWQSWKEFVKTQVSDTSFCRDRAVRVWQAHHFFFFFFFTTDPTELKQHHLENILKHFIAFSMTPVNKPSVYLLSFHLPAF